MDFLNNITWLECKKLLRCPFEKRNEVKFQTSLSGNNFFLHQRAFYCLKIYKFYWLIRLLAKSFEWKDKAQISVISHDKFCFYYILVMEKFQSFRSMCLKLIKKLCFCAYANIQFKEPIRIFIQNFQVKMTVI